MLFKDYAIFAFLAQFE